MSAKIDLRNVINSKLPRTGKFIPGFAVRWLERLVRLEKINYVLENYYRLPPEEFIAKTLEYTGVTYSVHGIENIPGDKRVVLASNHPLGGLDGLIFVAAVAPHVDSLKFIVNDLLMNIEPLRPLFVPINKHGSQNQLYAQGINELYNSNDTIITFPAGLCSRLIDGRIQDPPWKRNFVTKALQSDRKILPVFIQGYNSCKFYRLAKWRKKLGIRFNLEMMLLPAEMFDQKGRQIDIYIGAPVKPDKSISAQEWTERIRRAAYRLGPEPDKKFKSWRK